MAAKIVNYPKKTAEQILKDSLPNEYLISVIDQDFAISEDKEAEK